MPRKLGNIPAYSLHRSSGQAIVRISGRDHYLGPHNSPESREKYDRLIAEWLANGRQPLRDTHPIAGYSTLTAGRVRASRIPHD